MESDKGTCAPKSGDKALALGDVVGGGGLGAFLPEEQLLQQLHHRPIQLRADHLSTPDLPFSISTKTTNICKDVPEVKKLSQDKTKGRHNDYAAISIMKQVG